MTNSRTILATLAALALCGAAAAEGLPAPEPAAVALAQGAAPEAAAEVDLDAFLWTARPLVVFADTPDDPRFIQQMDMLDRGTAELEDLRVVVLTDTDPAAKGPLRQALRPRGFGIVLIDVDGVVVQRRPTPTSVRELAGTIDRLPSRRQETGSRRR
jgi:hypothetical protein